MTESLAKVSKTRDRILAAAMSLFYQHGVRAVGVERVVAESGVAKPTLYQHFASKDELVAACLREHSAHWQTNMAGVRTRRGNPGQRVAAVFDVLSRSYTSPDFRGCPFINTAAEYPDAPGPVTDAIKAHRADVRAMFSELLSDLPASTRRRVVDQTVIVYDGAMVNAQHGDGARVARLARQAAIRLASDR